VRILVEKAGDVEPHRHASSVGESGEVAMCTLLGRRQRDEQQPAWEDRDGESGGNRLRRKMQRHGDTWKAVAQRRGEGGGTMALSTEEWRHDRIRRPASEALE
jgi:hypothetical protein